MLHNRITISIPLPRREQTPSEALRSLLAARASRTAELRRPARDPKGRA